MPVGEGVGQRALTHIRRADQRDVQGPDKPVNDFAPCADLAALLLGRADISGAGERPQRLAEQPALPQQPLHATERQHARQQGVGFGFDLAGAVPERRDDLRHLREPAVFQHLGAATNHPRAAVQVQAHVPARPRGVD